MFAKLTIAASAVAVVLAQPPPPSTWYGIAPDTNIPGQINLFSMDIRGQPIQGVASVPTADDEYPKPGTLSCLWGSPVCYFLAGVARPYTQDYVYAVNRTSGALLFKHTVPQGIYLDNLALDWTTDQVFSVAFDPTRGPGGFTANLIAYNGANGQFTQLLDISRDINGGFIYAGAVSVCPTTKMLYIGLDVNVDDGSFADQVLAYDISVNPPVLRSREILLFPIPSSVHAFCNATSLVGLFGDYIQSATIDRETVVLGNIVEPGREGLFFPFATGDLPTFNGRGEVPLFLNGMLSEHQGTFLVPVFPPFQNGPGPAPQLPGGFLWSWTYTGRPGGRPLLSPIGYFLAGASGVPGR